MAGKDLSKVGKNGLQEGRRGDMLDEENIFKGVTCRRKTENK